MAGGRTSAGTVTIKIPLGDGQRHTTAEKVVIRLLYRGGSEINTANDRRACARSSTLLKMRGCGCGLCPGLAAYKLGYFYRLVHAGLLLSGLRTPVHAGAQDEDLGVGNRFGDPMYSVHSTHDFWAVRRIRCLAISRKSPGSRRTPSRDAFSSRRADAALCRMRRICPLRPRDPHQIQRIADRHTVRLPVRQLREDVPAW